MARTPGKGFGDAVRGATAAERKRNDPRESPFTMFAAREGFDFDAIDSPTLCDGIAHALQRDCALTFALTRDGGAVRISLWLDGVKHDAYAGTPADFDAILGSLMGVPEPRGSEKG
jgi:hypothetical protein